MARKQNNSRLGQIRSYIQQNPDQKAGAVARNLGLDNKTVQRALVHLEDRGDLLAEDDSGRVRWFGVCK